MHSQRDPPREPWEAAHGRQLVDGADYHRDGTGPATDHHADRSAAAGNLGGGITNRA
jgi:hypothetical protein